VSGSWLIGEPPESVENNMEFIKPPKEYINVQPLSRLLVKFPESFVLIQAGGFSRSETSRRGFCGNRQPEGNG
jgi:hypothetical protein